MITTEITVAALNRLIDSCKASAHGLHKAANTITDDNWKAVLASYAQQRLHFIAALKAEIYRQGGRLEQRGGIPSNTATHGWPILRDTLHNRTETLLQACLQGEAMVMQCYTDVLAIGLPADVQVLIHRQSSAIKRNYEHIATAVPPAVQPQV